MFQIITPIERNDSGGDKLLRELFDQLSHKLSIKNRFIFIFKNQILENSNKSFLNFFNKRLFMKIIALRSLIPNTINIYKQIKRQSKENHIYVCSHYLSCLPLLLTKLNKVKVNYIFFIQASEWKFLKNKLLKIIIKSIVKNIYLDSYLNIFTSKNLKNEFESELKLVTKSKNNGIIYPIWSQYPENFNYINSNEREIDVLFCLRNGFVKAPEKYIDFFKYLRNKYKDLKIIGFAPENFRKTKSVDRNFEIRFNLNKAEIFNLYQNSKVFICLSRYEGFGLTPLEAMSCGCIPIVLANNGCKNYLDNFPELILRNFSTNKEIMSKLIEIIFDDNKRKLLSIKVRETFESGKITNSNIRLDSINQISKFIEARDLIE